MMENVIKKIGLLVLIVALLTISSLVVAVILSFGAGTTLATGNVAVIPIEGVISNENPGFLASGMDTQYIRDSIKRASEDSSIKAIVLEINSPGGAPVASDEIGIAVKQANKTTVAFIRDTGASGAYWIASNAKYIIANRMSITGSVGVTASYIDFAGTLARFNATYEQLTGGQYKELGSQFANLTPDERLLLQRKIDMLHEFFLSEVQQNRNLSNSTVQTISTGEFYLGAEAIKLGLVDELGSYPELDAYLTKKIGETPVYVTYEKPKGLLDSLYGLKQSLFPSTKTSLQITA